MSKRKLLLFALMFVLPVQVFAWTLTTRIMSAGGSLQVRDNPVPTGGYASIITCFSCHVSPHAAAAFNPFSFKTYSGGSYQGRVVCFNCHGGPNTAHFFTKVVIDNACFACHASMTHNPAPTMNSDLGGRHFNGFTLAINPAYRGAYVTTRTNCIACHLDTTGFDPYSTHRKQWAGSAHGDIAASAWKNTPGVNWTRADGCVRCHSAEGFGQQPATTKKAAGSWPAAFRFVVGFQAEGVRASSRYPRPV